MGRDTVRVGFHSLLIFDDGLVEPPATAQGVSEIAMHKQVLRIELQNPLEFRNGFVEPSAVVQGVAEIVVRDHERRINLDGILVLGDGLGSPSTALQHKTEAAACKEVIGTNSQGFLVMPGRFVVSFLLHQFVSEMEMGHVVARSRSSATRASTEFRCPARTRFAAMHMR